MRCLNCGWDNDPQTIQCVKCNISLSGTMGAGLAPSHTRGLQDTVSDQGQVGGTIPSAPVDLPPWDAASSPTPRPAGNDQQCECGYHLAPQTTVCPNCQRTVNRQVGVKQPANPIGAGKPLQGTIDPFREPANRTRCSLQPVARHSEAERPEITFSGEQVDLNRDNVDPGNPTITGQVQAKLLLENGTWFLVDQSQVQTTFLQAGRKLALQDGDILLMGDRKFVFKSDSNQG